LTHRAEQQLIVLNALDRGELLMAEAADLLGLSTRQVRRLRRAYRRHCAKALVHGNRGRRSPSASVTLSGSGSCILPARPTLGSITSTSASYWPSEKVSRCLIARSTASSGRPGCVVRGDRRCDGRGPGCHVSGPRRRARLLRGLSRPRSGQGHPGRRVQRSPRHLPPAAKRPLTLQEQLAGKPAPTQVARALQELGTRWIPASSPQATDEIVKPRRYPGWAPGRKIRVDAGDPRPKSGARGWKPHRVGCPSGR